MTSSLSSRSDQRRPNRIAFQPVIPPVESGGGRKRYQRRQQLAACQPQRVEEIVLANLPLRFIQDHGCSPMMFCLLQTCRAARGRPTEGRTEPQTRKGFAFVFAAFPLSLENLRNGPEPSRARGLCAAKRTLDGEDRSGTWSGRERRRGSQGASPWRGSGAAPRAPYRAFFARHQAFRPPRFTPPPVRNLESPRTPTCSS